MAVQPKSAAQPLSERNNIILKAFVHELALALDTALIPTAHAAGIDRSAMRLARELAARNLECAEV